MDTKQRSKYLSRTIGTSSSASCDAWLQAVPSCDGHFIAGSGLMHRIRKGWFGIRHLCSPCVAEVWLRPAMWERTAPSINVAQCVRAPYACRFIQKDPRERLGLRSKARRQFRRDRLLCEQIFLAVSPRPPIAECLPRNRFPSPGRLEARRSTGRRSTSLSAGNRECARTSRLEEAAGSVIHFGIGDKRPISLTDYNARSACVLFGLPSTTPPPCVREVAA